MPEPHRTQQMQILVPVLLLVTDPYGKLGRMSTPRDAAVFQMFARERRVALVFFFPRPSLTINNFQ